MKKSIIVTTEKVAFHKYDDAPEEVKFLRNLHRHKFYIKLGIEVFHNDRELEFFIVQNKLNNFLKDKDIINSCEMLGEEIHKWAKETFKVAYPRKREIFVEVFEDNENGARVE